MNDVFSFPQFYTVSSEIIIDRETDLPHIVTAVFRKYEFRFLVIAETGSVCAYRTDGETVCAGTGPG